jgi:hypothetical protein
MKLLGPNDLIWSYNKLCRYGSHRALIQIERDSKYPDMWRVVRPDGSLTDMVNLTRAKDAAMSLALRALNAPVVANMVVPQTRIPSWYEFDHKPQPPRQRAACVQRASPPWGV